MHGSRGARCGMDLPYQGRAICSCAGELPSGSHRYIASTSSPRMPNQLRVVEHIEHTGEVTCLSVIPHSEEVRAICAIETTSTCSPSPPVETIITAYRDSYNSKQEHCRLCTTVVDPSTMQGKLIVVCEIDLKHPCYRVNRLVTSSDLLSSTKTDDAASTAGPSTVGVVDGEGFRVYDFSRLQAGDAEHEAVLTCKHETTAPDGDKEGPNLCSSGCFDPHHTRVLITVGGTCLNVWDVRANKISASIDRLHGPAKVTDVDFNPNIPYHVLTAGEDGSIRIWDIRNGSRKPVQTCKDAHSHWVTCARYNPYHDQLIASTGTDGAVKLWNTKLSGGSTPRAQQQALGGGSSREEVEATGVDAFELFKVYEGHEDSIYGFCWSSSDAWSFASLSHEGRVMFGEVPAEQKYRILL
eukprot:GHVS01067111.1.p1 GENE.GHVS01067111.1~~GHVS01067111.1.p1  ORF type:complete len:411 (-),score=67.12 GHVS01067111.1:366-1598(-)